MSIPTPHLALLLPLLVLTLQSPTLLTVPLHPSPLSNVTHPPLDLSGDDTLECFNLTTPEAHPINPADCVPAIDLLYHDPTGIMTVQRYSRDPDPVRHPETFIVPYAWQVGSCQVMLTSGADGAVDRFRLADVVVRAELIIQTCPQKSKRALGGLALVGNDKSFFVVVNGPDPGVGLLGGDSLGEGGGAETRVS